MGTYRHNIHGGEITVFGAAARFVENGGHYTRVDVPAPVEEPASFDPMELKGAALEDALDQWGLAKSGNADEKRKRIFDHLNPAEDVDPPVDDLPPTDPSQDQHPNEVAPEEQS